MHAIVPHTAGTRSEIRVLADLEASTTGASGDVWPAAATDANSTAMSNHR
jgi:hypothetical protein